MTPTPPRRTLRRPAIALVALTAMAAGGCQLFSWTVATFVRPPKTPARYTLDPDARVLVVPDSRHGRLETPAVRDLLAEKVNRRLAAENLVAETVPYQWLRFHRERMDLSTAGGGGAPLEAMARKASADAVIYIDIRSLRLRATPGAALWHGRMTASVSVVDADGQRLWPTDRQGGYPLTVELPPASDDSTTYDLTLAEQLTDRMADEVVRLFYAHRPASPG